MALLWTVVSVSFSIIITPFLMFLLAIIFLASIGKSLGVRRLYVKILLKIFEYGRQHIEIAKKDQRREMVTGSSCEGDGDGDADADATEDEGAAAASTAAAVERVAGAGAEAAAGADAGAGDAAHAPTTRRPSPGGGAKAPACNGSAGALLSNGALPNSLSVISREDLILSPVPSLNSANGAAKEGLPRSRSFETLKREFELADCLEFVKAGVEAIIEDEVTLRFEAEELKSWNLLTRTNSWYEFISWRLTVIWVLGFLVRYCFLLPLRVLICFIGVAWAVLSMAVLGFLPPSSLKRWLHKRAFIITFRILARCLSMVLTYHDTQYRPDKGGVCVANHTSPIDIITVSTESCFSLIGQRHGGFLGVLQRALARASPHIWFERSEVKDREAVAKRLRQHVSDPKNPPILIFPEGTCINNTSVMQFKKGSFEVGGVIYPVAIKYDPKFGDAFWNSSRFSMMQYLYMMMTSWAIVCDVWYLPPMYQKEGETAIDFANRVKSCIARQGGLVDLMWDGQLKRMKAKKEWKEAQQEEYSKRLKLE